MYTIGEVSNEFNLTASTIRYYDKEGLLQNVERNDSGIRRFNDSDLETLRVIECLKKAGLKIKDIKQFLSWCDEGDSTITKRKNMFYDRRVELEKQIEELQDVLKFVDYKCDYYTKAETNGSVIGIDSKKINEILDK